ncbi:hypothetical protein [Gordonia rhizosphera]|uniref:hypothetical protein n=1 Tax=Gordonia rhizosphera TaxID=83341 RepID=UPI0012F6D4C1|nr:hypothetical protein [Gordonia rhizosphera]
MLIAVILTESAIAVSGICTPLTRLMPSPPVVCDVTVHGESAQRFADLAADGAADAPKRRDHAPNLAHPPADRWP